MNFKPILFSTPMVHAILEGRKTMTRRLAEDAHDTLLGYERVTDSPTYPPMWKGKESEPYTGWVARFSNLPIAMPRTCRYGQPGDVLWVRESWNKYHSGQDELFAFRASDTEFPFKGWKPSIHMPKSACRIFLEITEIRVERLQDISEEDAIAEGVIKTDSGDSDIPGVWYKDYVSDASGYGDPDHDFPIVSSPVESFGTLWQSINGVESWEANPWVWVVSFKRIERPNNFLTPQQ